jgi:SAM-dependent methyltransferase
MQDALNRHIGTMHGLSCVELGSGRGDLSALLAEQGAAVTLLDASLGALQQAAERFERLGLPASLVMGDLFTPPPTMHNHFDVVLSSGVIEHFNDARRTQSILAHWQLTRPGGVVIISVPAATCPTYRIWKCYWELRGWWPYGFEKPYSRRELLRRSAAAGLVHCSVSSFGTWQSLGDHLLKNVLRLPVPDWSTRSSWLDEYIGSTHLLIAYRPSLPSPDSSTAR